MKRVGLHNENRKVVVKSRAREAHTRRRPSSHVFEGWDRRDSCVVKTDFRFDMITDRR